MYWTHLIFVLLYGVVIPWNQITASKPGYLDFDNLPETNFSCDKKVIGGYYADVETGCQMFHVCTIGQKGEVTDIKFLCLNGTVFDQETRVCERIDEVDCSKSEDFFGLNLELYGNNANLGIQPENEFECEDCSTDDDYEESEETTTFTTSTTTTTTTTTTPKPTTTATTTTTARPTKYQSPSQDTIAALLALHNAFNQGLQNSKVKPAPPRVINNAFAPTKSTPKPYTTYTTQRSGSNFKPHNYNSDSQSFGSLNLQQQERPYYFTPTTERTNYHHFHSGDTSFGHSYDSTRPYNFQYFHARKLPEAQGTISVVTSTSTSTSVRTSKGNTTVEYPTGYEDYQDDTHEVHDSFFDDVPKIRQKRGSLIFNATQNQDTKNHFDKYYSFEKKLNAREEFLQNLLGSIDMEDGEREKMSKLFKKEETEMENLENSGGFKMNLGNKLGEMVTLERNISKIDEIQESANKLAEWKKQFDDMRKDINLNYTFETNVKDVEDKISRKKRETTNTDIRRRTGGTVSTKRPQQRRGQTSSTETTRPTRRKVIRQKIDTEKFNFGTNRRSNEGQQAAKPVFEAIEDDLTTIEYRKTSRKGREQPRATTSLRRNLKFNYETTTALSEPERRPTVLHREAEQRSTVRPGGTSESNRPARIAVLEDRHLGGTSESNRPAKIAVHEEHHLQASPARRSRGRVRARPESTTTSTTPAPLTTNGSLSPSPDPDFSCDGKVKGGFYADMYSDCKGFFICSQGAIDGPLLKTHFWCGATTKFNQRSRTCQAEALVECSVSPRYFHLNNDFLVPASEDELKGSFEPLKVS